MKKYRFVSMKDAVDKRIISVHEDKAYELEDVSSCVYIRLEDDTFLRFEAESWGDHYDFQDEPYLNIFCKRTLNNTELLHCGLIDEGEYYTRLQVEGEMEDEQRKVDLEKTERSELKRLQKKYGKGKCGKADR